MNVLRICIAMMIGQLVWLTSAAATPLPAASWYAVVWARGQDTLHWINRDGAIASRPRPALDQEAADSTARLNIARAGRYILMAGVTTADHEVLGIYDLQEGDFTGTLTAQAGVEIRLGGAFATNQHGSRAAVVFVSTAEDDENWQVITFNLAEGAPLAFLDSSHVTRAAGSAPSYPRIRLYLSNEATEQDNIHFQLLPKTGEIPEAVPAYAWSPDAAAATMLQASPFERATADLNALTREEVFAYELGELPFTPLAPALSTDNAIGSLAPLTPGAETTSIYHDQQRFLSKPLWAKRGDWIAVFTESGEQGVSVGWQVLSPVGAQEERQLVALPTDVREVFGTPDGLLAVTTDGQLRHLTSLDDITGSLLHPPAEVAMELIQVVYVSKTPDEFTLTELAEIPAQ